MRNSIHSNLQKLHKLSKQFLDDGGLPDFVKSGNTEDMWGKDDQLQKTVFADPVRKQYPCHTKAATYTSALYLWGDRANDVPWASSYPFENAARRIEKAAAYWGIAPVISNLVSTIKKKSETAQRELTDGDYALVVDYGDERIRRFPVVNRLSVKRAAENLTRDRVHYPYTWRKASARAILKTAMGMGLTPQQLDLDGEVFNYLLKAASLYTVDPRLASARLCMRAQVLPERHRDKLRKAAAVVRGGGRCDLEKLCEIVDDLDREGKCFKLYREGMPLPEELFFCGLPQKQASVPSIQLVTGSSYAVDDLQRVGVTPLRALSPEYVGAFTDAQGNLDMSKVAVVLPTIPRDDAVLLEKALDAAGVKPMAAVKEATLVQEFPEYSMEALTETFGKPKHQEFRAVFNLKHDQGTHDELEEKHRKAHAIRQSA